MAEGQPRLVAALGAGSLPGRSTVERRALPGPSPPFHTLIYYTYIHLCMTVKKGTTIRVDDAFMDFLYRHRRRGMSHQDVLEELLGLDEEPDYEEDDDYDDEEGYDDE